jgi:putative transposase
VTAAGDPGVRYHVGGVVYEGESLKISSRCCVVTHAELKELTDVSDSRDRFYHPWHRSVGRIRRFDEDAHFEAFQQVIVEAHQRHPIRILAYCVLSHHWHFLVWPEADGQVTDFFRWLAHTHAMRWRVAHQTVGHGHLDQGRFKSFPVQSDEHLLTVLRYVERNAVGAELVVRAKDWRWGSLWARRRGDAALKAILSPWPVERPRD